MQGTSELCVGIHVVGIVACGLLDLTSSHMVCSSYVFCAYCDSVLSNICGFVESLKGHCIRFDMS